MKTLHPQEENKNISWKVQAIDHTYSGSEFASADTIIASRDLEFITYNEMVENDLLTWEYLFPDSITNFQLQLDDDVNFSDPLEQVISLSKESSSVKDLITYYKISLNELADFDSLISNTKYYWRVKPNYIYRPGRYSLVPHSFIYDPSYSIPSPVHISVMGEFVTLTWNNVKDAEKSEVYNVYSSDDPYAVFPAGWTKVAVAYTNEWTVKTSERKKFYCVTAAGSVK
ncbi:MAG: hypothetical protein WC212_07670 [Candidatus Delongbacteria bacterium]